MRAHGIAPALRAGEAEVGSSEGEGDRVGRLFAVCPPDHPHPRRLRRLDLSHFVGEVIESHFVGEVAE
jgi:hypothetical protein